MVPARRAPSACQAKCASSAPCCTSLGHTRNTHGLNPDSSGLDADGEIIATGSAPAPYTRAAAIVAPDERCPTTATTVGSAYSRSATRSEEHTSELQSQFHIVCRLLLGKKNLRS